MVYYQAILRQFLHRNFSTNTATSGRRSLQALYGANMKLLTNLGCPGALKVIAANQISGRNIKVEEMKPDSGHMLLPGNHKGSQILVLEDGKSIFEANTICRYLMADKDAGVDKRKLTEVVEWDSACLQGLTNCATNDWLQKKAVVGDLLSKLNNHLAVVEMKLKESSHLISNTLSSADIIVWSSFYGAFTSYLPEESVSQYPGVKAWFDTLSRNSTLQNAAEVAMKGKGVESFKEFVSSSAAVSHPSRSASRGSSSADPKQGPSAPSCNDEREAEGPSAEEISVAKQHWNHGKPPSARIYKHPILPQDGEKNILITSALPYVNNVPHLGNIIGCVLSADVYARYCRLRNYNVVYICGTDEYGTATETKALQEGLTPQQICDKYHKLHADVYKWFNIEFDFFGRTTTTHQTEIAQDIFWKLHKNGYLLEDTVEQLFCENCSRYLADRFVEGSCPSCSYEDARGDQCDSCGKLINAVELKNPRCKVCGQCPIIKETRHVFLDLPKIDPMLRTWCDEQIDKGLWTNNARQITRGWIQDGLKPRCITRDLKWGTPVPLPGFQDKVFYVWFDAPIGYLSITANYTSEWRQWWNNPDKVRLVQFMAKDNVPFHTVVFPCSLLGAKDNYTMLTDISATEYLNYEDDKFSKSRGVGVFGNDATDTGIPADIYRFYLLYSRPESQDSVFTWAEFATRNNSELLNNLGNFVNRALSFLKNNFNGKVPEITMTADDYSFVASVNTELAKYINGLEHIKIRDSLRDILMISKLGNQYIQANKPWVLAKGSAVDRTRAGTVIGLAANLSALISVLLNPYMPVVSAEIASQLALPKARLTLPEHFVPLLTAGHEIGTPKPLFDKIEMSVMDALKVKFQGKPNAAASAAARAKKPASQEAKPADAAMTTAELEQRVTKQGEVVRLLKTQKAEKVDVDREVSLLLDLKKKLAISKGEDPNAAPAKQGKSKKKKK